MQAVIEENTLEELLKYAFIVKTVWRRVFFGMETLGAGSGQERETFWGRGRHSGELSSYVGQANHDSDIGWI